MNSCSNRSTYLSLPPTDLHILHLCYRQPIGFDLTRRGAIVHYATVYSGQAKSAPWPNLAVKTLACSQTHHDSVRQHTLL